MSTEEKKPDFIPCITFVKRGVGKARPERVKATKEELREIIKDMKMKEAMVSQSEGNADSKTHKEKNNDSSDEDNAIDDFYGMDDYDDEPTDIASSIPVDNLILENSDHEDDSNDEDTEDEEDEFAVQPTDNLMLVGHVDDDACMLEVYVFNNEKADLFILHDILLPSYPTCIEWLDFDPKNAESTGHFAAVGSMTPQIDVWDLNVSGCLEPAFTLGAKKGKGTRHKDAVIDLAWNKENRNVMASGSADNTVILWNLADLTALSKYSVFEDRVQSLKWHPVEAHNLLTGSSDKKVRLFDCRSTCTFKTWTFEGEIEKILWNKFDPMYFFVSTDQGMVHYVDIRHPKPVWNLKAHDKEVTGIAHSSHCADLFLTGSTDEAVKVWDIKDSKPHLVTNKSMNIGSIYSLSSCPDVPYVFCAGGTKNDNNVYLWDIRESEAVMRRFHDRNLEHVGDIVVPVHKDDADGSEMDVEPTPSTSQVETNPLQTVFRPVTNRNDGRIEKSKKKKQNKP